MKNRIVQGILVVLIWVGGWYWYMSSCDGTGGVVTDYGLDRGRYAHFWVRFDGRDRFGDPCTCSTTISYRRLRHIEVGDSIFNP